MQDRLKVLAIAALASGAPERRFTKVTLLKKELALPVLDYQFEADCKLMGALKTHSLMHKTGTGATRLLHESWIIFPNEEADSQVLFLKHYSNHVVMCKGVFPCVFLIHWVVCLLACLLTFSYFSS